MTVERRTSVESGLLYGVAAYGLWGLFPLFWPFLEPAGALEILACRIVCSLLFVGIVLAATGRLASVRRISHPALNRLAVAGAVVAVNWGVYIWGVNNGEVVQTSLGYFINPLLTVALSVVLLGERLRSIQWMAIAFGVIAVAVLTWDYGHPPWIALALASSFATYGFIKNRVGVSAPEGLFVEAAVLTLPALVVLGVLAGNGTATWVGARADAGHLALLLASGPATAVPLLFFAGAARRLPLSTVGLLQYLAPVMQFLIGVLVRREPLPPARLAGFVLVWLALVILTAEAVRHRGRVTPIVADG